MRWIRAHFLLILIYGVFATTGSRWISQWLKFRGVEDWPTAEARIVKSGSVSLPYQYDYRDGHHEGKVTASHVTFEYSVGGHTYRSHRVSPDGGGLPVSAPDQTWKAHYKPNSPELAVLNPIPFRGTGWLLAAFACSILIGFHLYLVLPDLIARNDWRLGTRKP